jgi:hypothetical protein
MNTSNKGEGDVPGERAQGSSFTLPPFATDDPGCFAISTSKNSLTVKKRMILRGRTSEIEFFLPPFLINLLQRRFVCRSGFGEFFQFDL